MTQDEMEVLWRAHGEAAAKAAFASGYGLGHDNGEAAGFLKGLALGHTIGYSEGHHDGVSSCTEALADGLRLGSSPCGTRMQALREDRSVEVDYVTDAEYAIELLGELPQ